MKTKNLLKKIQLSLIDNQTVTS
uniref:Uncharacterized protein n=1 Tax=Arundo donax TaxID=35708 RepID=A0A0A9AU33_ARUDO